MHALRSSPPPGRPYALSMVTHVRELSDLLSALDAPVAGGWALPRRQSRRCAACSGARTDPRAQSASRRSGCCTWRRRCPQLPGAQFHARGARRARVSLHPARACGRGRPSRRSEETHQSRPSRREVLRTRATGCGRGCGCDARAGALRLHLGRHLQPQLRRACRWHAARDTLLGTLNARTSN